MKKTSYLTEVLLLVIFVTTTLITTSCGNNQNSKDSKAIAEERNEAQFDDNKKENDAQFLVNAAEFNLEQIQLAKLAQQKGNTAQVMEMGKTMEVAYTKSFNDLKALANRKSITIPTSHTNDARDAYNDLNERKTNDFDKAYADRMVKQHKDAIDFFEEATTERYDVEIKNWAISTLPEMRTNLNLLTDFQNNYDKNYGQNRN